jgi:riboflavin kinase / FMN adenylyltransferase
MRSNKIPAKVRQALAEGNIRQANTVLRDIYSLHGTVVKGQQLGRVLGFPTANLKLNQHSPLFLANGIYAVKVTLDNITYNGMANIGIRPTLDQHELTIEVNIFEFNRDIYGQELVVHFIDRIRDEEKFNTLDELKGQIAKDKIRITGILSTGMHPDPHSK